MIWDTNSGIHCLAMRTTKYFFFPVAFDVVVALTLNSGVFRLASQPTSKSELFARLATELTHDGGIDDPPPAGAKGFGSGALKVNGKIFAMSVDESLVLKLPRARVLALIESGAGTPFDPGHGRVMKEWVVLIFTSNRSHWRARRATSSRHKPQSDFQRKYVGTRRCLARRDGPDPRAGNAQHYDAPSLAPHRV